MLYLSKRDALKLLTVVVIFATTFVTIGLVDRVRGQTAGLGARGPVSAPASAPTLSPMTRFARIVEGDRDASFEVAITPYRSARGVTVDLVGVVHVADRSLYRALNARLVRYDVVLYEMILNDMDDRLPPPPEAPPPPMNFWDKSSSDHLATWLKLDRQEDWLDYTPAHFTHADVDAKGLEDLTAEQLRDKYGGSKERAFTRAFVEGFRRAVKPPKLPWGPMDLIEATRAGPDRHLRMRRIMAQTLAADLRDYDTDEAELIIDARNRVAIERLDEVLARQERGAGDDNGHRVAVFYGAGHMPGLERALLDRGFQPAGEPRWLRAWTMSPKPATQPATSQPATRPATASSHR